MATLKEFKEKQKFTKELIQKIENILHLENGKWNNVEKIYQFQFGQKFNIEHVYLSEKCMVHIVNSLISSEQ